jgi:quinol monooxygenase YgiN
VFHPGDALSVTPEDLRLMIDVNLGAALWLTQAVAPYMRDRGPAPARDPGQRRRAGADRQRQEPSLPPAGPARARGRAGRDRRAGGWILEAGLVSELRGIGRFKFHGDKLEEFKRLSAQAMEIVRAKDTGTLRYEVYFSDDESECIVLERYRDSEALAHSSARQAVKASSAASGSSTRQAMASDSA